MEDILLETTKTVSSLKNNIINYIIESADKNERNYLYKDYRNGSEVFLITIKDDRFCVKVQDMVKFLDEYDFEILLEFANKIRTDCDCIILYKEGIDEFLTDKINRCWREKQDRFKAIVELMIDNYYAEIPPLNLADWHDIRIFVTHYCDDNDLECIIKFCRIE